MAGGPSRPRARPPKHSLSVRSARDARDALRRRSLELVKKISDKDKFAIFLDPVPCDEVPGYLDVITRPMDLGTVKSNVLLGVYHAPNDLRGDLDLIWANCIKFNAPSTIYHKEAVRLRALSGKFFEEYLRILGRDGLPYGPKASQKFPNNKNKPTSTGGVSSAQLQVSPDDPAATPLHTVSQRFRNVARARTKLLQANRPPSAPLTDLENAAINAANTLLPTPEKKQIYDGPYQRIRRFPNAHAASTFPYVQGSRIEKYLQPFPYAWQTLGKHQHDPSNLSYSQRLKEMSYANQYQSFVTNSAPIARRLLATILDPLAVLEHDARTQPSKQQSSPVIKKRPRHGDIPRSSQQHQLNNTVHNNLGMDICEITPEKKNVNDNNNISAALPPSPPTLQKPSEEAVRDLQDVLKNHNIDYSFLNTILNSSNTEETKPSDMEISPSNALKPKPVNPTPRQNAVEDAETETQAVNNDIDTVGTETNVNSRGTNNPHKKKLFVQKQDTDIDEANSDSGSASEESDETDKSDESDEEISQLLASNHHAMQNILRLRSLKEVAIGEARADIEAEEAHCVSVLIEDMAKSTLKLTPHMLLPKVQAGIMLMDKAKSILSLKRKLDAACDAEKASKKSKTIHADDGAEGKKLANGVPESAIVANGSSNTKPTNATPANLVAAGKKMAIGNPKVAKVSQVDKVTSEMELR